MLFAEYLMWEQCKRSASIEVSKIFRMTSQRIHLKQPLKTIPPSYAFFSFIVI